jgi:hypothetical protein
MGLLYSFTGAATRTKLIIPWISGRTYDAQSYIGGGRSTWAIVANTIYSSPLWVPAGGVAIDRIGTEITVAAAAGKIARFMLYADNNGLPGALLHDAGTIAVDTTGEKSITVAYTLPEGRVHAALVSDGTPTVRILNMTAAALAAYGFPTLGAAAAGGAQARLNTDTTAPDPFSASGAASYTTATTVLVAVRAA